MSKANTAEAANYDVAIICALHRPELEKVLELGSEWTRLAASPDDPHSYSWTTFTTEKGASISVVAAATNIMGMPATAVLATKMILRFRPRLIVMVGIAAGVKNTTQGFGDILAPEHTFDDGSGKLISKDGAITFLPDPKPLDISPRLHGLLRTYQAQRTSLDEIYRKWNGPKPRTVLNIHLGPMASGAAVAGTRFEIDRAMEHWRKLVGVEMEAYAVHRAARDAMTPGPEFLCFKSICDFGENKDDNWQDYAAFTSAQFCHAFICREWENLHFAMLPAQTVNTSVAIEKTSPHTYRSSVVRQAVAALDSPDEGERNSGLKTLANTTGDEAKDALAAAMEHQIVDVAREAALLYPDRRDPRIVYGLVNTLIRSWHYESDIKQYPLARYRSELADFGKEAEPVLLRVLDYNISSDFRAWTVSRLGMSKNPAVKPAILKALGDTASNVRRAAADAAGRLRLAKAVPGLRRLLVENSHDVSDAAATALGLLRSKAAVPDLLAVVEGTGYSNVRTASVRALGEIGDRSVLPRITPIVDAPETWLAIAAAGAAAKLGDRGALKILRSFRQERRFKESEVEILRELILLGEKGLTKTIEERIHQTGDRSGLLKEYLNLLLLTGPEGKEALKRLTDRSDNRWVREAARKVLE